MLFFRKKKCRTAVGSKRSAERIPLDQTVSEKTRDALD